MYLFICEYKCLLLMETVSCHYSTNANCKLMVEQLRSSARSLLPLEDCNWIPIAVRQVENCCKEEHQFSNLHLIVSQPRRIIVQEFPTNRSNSIGKRKQQMTEECYLSLKGIVIDTLVWFPCAHEIQESKIMALPPAILAVLLCMQSEIVIPNTGEFNQ